MNDKIKSLKKLAGEQELEVIERPNGVVMVIGGKVNVTWWPDSRRMNTAANKFRIDHATAIHGPYKRTRLEKLKDVALAVVIGLALGWTAAGGGWLS